MNEKTSILFKLSLAAILLSGCWLGESQKKKGGSLNQKAGLIDRNREIIVERTAQRARVNLKFYTNELTHCKIEFWPKFLRDNPSPENRKVFNCDYEYPRDTHLVTISDSLGNDPLYFKIIVSPSSNFSSKSDAIALPEADSNLSFFPPAGYSSLKNEQETAVVLRNNLPLGQGKVHGKPTSQSTLNQQLALFKSFTPGCTSQIKRNFVPFLPPFPISLETITTSSFISGKTRRKDPAFGTLAVDFVSKNMNNSDWQINLQKGGEEHIFKAKKPSEFKLLTVRSGLSQENTIGPPNLVSDPGTFAASKSEDLIITWAQTFPDENGTVKVYLGKNRLGSSIECTFSSGESSIIIPSNLLAKLEPRTYDLVVTLNSKEYLSSESKVHFFIHSQDWRHRYIDLTGS